MSYFSSSAPSCIFIVVMKQLHVFKNESINFIKWKRWLLILLEKVFQISSYSQIKRFYRSTIVENIFLYKYLINLKIFIFFSIKRSNLQTTTTNNKITLNKLLISTLLGNQKVLVDLSNPNTQIYLEIVCCKTDVFITVLIAVVEYK